MSPATRARRAGRRQLLAGLVLLACLAVATVLAGQLGLLHEAPTHSDVRDVTQNATTTDTLPNPEVTP